MPSITALNAAIDFLENDHRRDLLGLHKIRVGGELLNRGEIASLLRQQYNIPKEVDVKTVRLTVTAAEEVPRVICGFPGVGKSSLFRNRGDSKIVDSDSSTFDKAEFPANYIAHIREKLAEGYTVLCSTHAEVRAALVQAGIPFALVYPKLDCRDEYMQRYTERGSPDAFIGMMFKNWEKFVQGCADQAGCKHVELDSGQYIPATLQELQKRAK